MQHSLQFITIAILPLIFAITLHEAAHAYVAYLLGDKTAYMLGRVTLNPTKHIDPIGTLLLPAIMLIFSNFIFGWAKPVPITWQNLKNPRRDMAIVAIAGPGANLLMAFIWAAIAKVCLIYLPATTTNSMLQSTLVFFVAAGNYGIIINLVLMILNLLPIPPLDGSRIVSSIIPPKVAYHYDKLEPYGLWIILALVFFGILFHIIGPPINIMNFWIHNIFHLPFM